MTVSWFKTLNQRFDQIQEPKRMIIFILMFLPAIILTSIPLSAISGTTNVILFTVGMSWIILAALFRMLYLYRKI